MGYDAANSVQSAPVVEQGRLLHSTGVITALMSSLRCSSVGTPSHDRVRQSGARLSNMRVQTNEIETKFLVGGFSRGFILETTVGEDDLSARHPQPYATCCCDARVLIRCS